MPPITDELNFQLPLRRMSQFDVCGVLFTLHPVEELWKDAILKLQTWIINFAEEQVAPLRESGEFTDEEIEKIKANSAVISPITVALYSHYMQMEAFAKMSDAEKEKWLLQRLPDRLKARFKGNVSNRNARDATEAEIALAEAGTAENENTGNMHFSLGDVVHQIMGEVQPEYLRTFIAKRKQLRTQ